MSLIDNVVGRARWGARYAAGVGARTIPTAECWLHHTVTLAPDLSFDDLDADSVDDDEAKAMREIEAIGQQRFGRGFSYNLALMPSGRLYVGCGVRRVGSHTGGRNTRALGIVLVGNYHARPLPEPMRRALPQLLREAHAAGWISRPAFDGGHRDLKDTSCPGSHAYDLIPQINREAASPQPPTPSEEPHVPLSDEDVARIAAAVVSPENVDRVANRVLEVVANGRNRYGLDNLYRLHVQTLGLLADVPAPPEPEAPAPEVQP